MPRCHRCQKSFKGDELYCEPCEEYKNQIHREEHAYLCSHCNKMFTTKGGFDQHAWLIYYRDHYRPIPHRVRL